ncbi:PorE family type IX secretion system protein [Prevotella lacticifex]|uniref:PorE family type IX secretion system protein n=1 Tax=Prevotella lacticifex TaxID=2854755 RepID=UPI001CC5ECB7|nr:OmpA family protein [Prevotella lacticifex]
MELKSIIQHRHSTDGGRPNVGWILVVILLLGFVSCGADRNIKKGDKYLSLGEYHDAAEQYKQAYRRIPPKERKARGQVSKKIALANDYINSSAKAIAAYRNVIRYHQDSPETHLKLAENLMKQGQYGDAAKEYQIVLDSLPGNKAAKEGLLAASEAPAEKKNASKYIVKKMDVFNSRRSDYSPMLFGDQYDQLYFTSTRNEAQGDELSGITGVKPGDIFYSEKDDKGHWGRPQTIESGLNTEFDEGTPAFSPDGREMYITQCTTDPSYPRYAKIAVSNRADASWGKATPLEISRDTLSSFAHPAISPDGNWLYFVSDMPGGKGGLDIWRVRLIGGTTGGVENLGEPINTPGDEEFPTFRPNGDLYFSSNGHGGLGGLDIFIAKVGKDHKFHLEHPGYPLNSQGDDFGCTFEGPHNRGFFSSNRGDARGWDHIYSFELPEIVQTVKGWVYEMEGYELPAAQVYMVGDDGTNLKLSVKGDGSFEQVIKPGVDYIMLASCKGYLNHKEELKVDSVSESKEYTLQFPLASIRVPVMIDNIFYDFDKATLRPESKKALDELVKLLNDNPNVTIELSAHCDYKGPAEYNKKLSQERANNVVAYLTEHGIAKDRLTPVGYGKEKPKTVRKKLTEKYPWLKENDVLTEDFIKKLDKDKQEICNQLNRRTEFIVLRTTYGMFDEKGNLKNPPKPKPQEEKSSDDNTYDIEIN